MSAETLARTIYAEFKAKPESQHIATEFALIELSKLIAELKPARILEIGAGIGTITKLILKHPARPQKLVATEAHPVCLRELERNLESVDLEGYTLINAPLQLQPDESFDLVIFDGTLDGERQYQIFKQGTALFVEGSRSETINTLRQKLQARGLDLQVETRRPGGMKWKLKSKRKLWGLPLPALRRRPIKGCSIGRVINGKRAI